MLHSSTYWQSPIAARSMGVSVCPDRGIWSGENALRFGSCKLLAAPRPYESGSSRTGAIISAFLRRERLSTCFFTPTRAPTSLFLSTRFRRYHRTDSSPQGSRPLRRTRHTFVPLLDPGYSFEVLDAPIFPLTEPVLLTVCDDSPASNCHLPAVFAFLFLFVTDLRYSCFSSSAVRSILASLLFPSRCRPGRVLIPPCLENGLPIHVRRLPF